MPWYKLPHSSLSMWFDQKMPDLKPGRNPAVKHVKKPGVKHVKPEPKEETEAT